MRRHIQTISQMYGHIQRVQSYFKVKMVPPFAFRKRFFFNSNAWFFLTHRTQFLNNKYFWIQVYSHYFKSVMDKIELKGGLPIGPLTSLCAKQYNCSIKLFSFPRQYFGRFVIIGAPLPKYKCYSILLQLNLHIYYVWCSCTATLFL